MDRLARLRTRSSAGGPLNASTTSSLAAGYETANDESLTSGSGSMYFSMTEGGDKTKGEEEEPEICAEEEPTLSGTLATSGHSGVDQTLENDFSVEEVSTIRKATIAHASPATVQVAAGMAVKYLGVSSTPAPKTPKVAKQEDLSGFDQLDQTPSIMKKMRDPKTPAEMASFAEDPEESKVTLDGSGVQGPVPSNKSYGTNVLANFFASLDVNSGTPAPPEIKISAPEEVPTAPTSGPTPSKRDSNSLENFFESLKKNPQPEAPANKRKSLVRKSLIPKVGSIVAAAAAKQNRVASPISRRSTTVRLIPDKLREMRKTNQQSDQLVQFRRKSTVIPATIPEMTKVGSVAQRKSMAVAAVRAVTATTTTTTNPALKRKSVMPTASSATAVNGRRSVLPAMAAVRRGVVTATANPPRVALKIPAKTTLSNGPEGPTTNSNGSTSTRRTLLGKRPATTITTTATSVTVTSSLPDKLPTNSSATTATEQPAAKQRKSLAPPKEPSPAIRVSPRNKPSTAPAVHLQSRIRPPTGIPGAGFKKPETFTCDQCQRIFRLKSSYETHLKTVHPAAGAAAAASSSTSTNSSLNKSSEGTTSGSGAKCQYCGKAFAGAKFLTNHIVSNCLKIPLLEKRRLLAEGERERAANLKRTPDAAKKSSRMLLRPPTGSGGNASNRSASSNRSGDETDTSTCSSNGGGGGGSATGSGGRKRAVTATTGSGASGISRTPNKELKCHLCARRFLNAVEYALHVQAHAKNLKGGGGDAPGGGEEDVENVVQGKEQEEKGKQMTEDVAKLMKKLVTIKNRNGIGGGAGGKVALKSSNSGNVSK